MAWIRYEGDWKGLSQFISALGLFLRFAICPGYVDASKCKFLRLNPVVRHLLVFRKAPLPHENASKVDSCRNPGRGYVNGGCRAAPTERTRWASAGNI